MVFSRFSNTQDDNSKPKLFHARYDVEHRKWFILSMGYTRIKSLAL